MDKKMDTARPPPTAACGALRAVKSGRLPLVRFSLRRNPRRRSEHLVEVPADVILAGRWLPGLRREEQLADEPKNQLLCGTAASDEVRGDGDLMVVTYAQDTAVEELVMEVQRHSPFSTVSGPSKAHQRRWAASSPTASVPRRPS